MKRAVIADTGVLIAYLNRREKFHNWAKEQLIVTFSIQNIYHSALNERRPQP